MAAQTHTVNLINDSFDLSPLRTLEQLRQLMQPSYLGESYLHTLAREGDALTLELLLDSEMTSDIDLADAQGSRPLHEACRYGHLDVVRVLISAGAKIDGRFDPLGVSPLMLACEKKATEVVRHLVRYGANVNQRHRLSGKTALHIAAESGDTLTAGVLLAAGAQASAEDRIGKTARDYAAQSGHKDLEQILIKVMAHRCLYRT